MIVAEEDRIVEKAPVKGETQAEFVGRSFVHLFARPLVPALDVILDSERIPNRQFDRTRGIAHSGSADSWDPAVLFQGFVLLGVFG